MWGNSEYFFVLNLLQPLNNELYSKNINGFKKWIDFDVD